MRVFIQIGHGIIGAAVISGLCIWQAGNFGEARHTLSIIGAIQSLFPAKSLDPMGQSSDLAQISSTTRFVRLVLGAIAFCIPTPGVAFVADAPARVVELRHGYRCEFDISWGAPNSAPMPSYPCPDPTRQYGVPWTKETGAR